jgi:hypothetical protein
MNTDTGPTAYDTNAADLGLDGDPDDVPLPRLEAHICTWAGRLAAATCAWLLAVAAFDRRKGWAGVGARSCAHWLSWRCGLSLRAGYDHLRLAHALERLPALREAFTAGRISYSKARAISRVADPGTDAAWVGQALTCTADHLDRLVAAHARLHPADADDAGRRHERRRLWWRWDHEGMLVAQIVLPPEDGALFVKAVDAARTSLDDTDPVEAPTADPGPVAEPAADGHATAAAGGEDDGDGEDDARATVTRERTLDADALVAVAAGFLASGAPALSDPTRHTVNVHVHADALAAAYTGIAHTAGDAEDHGGGEDHTDSADHSTDVETDRGHATGDTPVDNQNAEHPVAGDAGREHTRTTPEHDRPAAAAAPRDGTAPQEFPAGPLTGLRCDVQPGLGLAPETVRRLACDAWLRALVVDRAGNPLDLGRRRRTATGRVRDAVYARDQGTCRYPGCARTRWLDVHHLDHWADHHGQTEPPNLVLLCGHHHRAVHEGGMTLRMDARGAVTAHLPDGRTLHPAPSQHAGAEPLTRFTRATADVHPQAADLGWIGVPHHPSAAHTVLLRRRRPASGSAA